MRLTRVLLLTAACAGLAFGQAKEEQEVKSAKDQQPPPEKKAPKTEAAKPASEAEKAPGRNESVAVHGHWVLQVNNPDGSVASRHEFENSLATNGAIALGAVLTGGLTVGYWGIQIGAGIGQTQATELILLNCSGSPPGFYCAASLNVSPNNTTGAITLQGTTLALPAAGAGTVAYVETLLELCPNNVTPPNCGLANYVEQTTFTYYAAPTTGVNAVTVMAGQSITVTVTISFH